MDTSNVLTRKAKFQILFISLFWGLVLGTGFLSTTESLAQFLTPYLAFLGGIEKIRLITPIFLALFFVFTFPKTTPPNSVSGIYLKWLLPLAIAFIAGIFFKPDIQDPHSILWVLVVIPLVEEMIFRGWLFQLYYFFYQYRWLSWRVPMPAVVVGSALSFSLWHLQNLSSQTFAQVALQMGTTFFIGILLGLVRMHQNHLGGAVFLHILLNSLYWLGSKIG